jgi:hypothetical protein
VIRTIILSLLLLFYSTRAYLRTFEWSNNTSLFLSACREAPNDLFRGLRFAILAGLCNIGSPQNTECSKYMDQAITALNNVMNLPDKPCPDIIKYYGLDTQSQKGKAAYILSYVLIEQKVKDPYILLRPYMKTLTDTQIAHHYLAYLIQSNQLDEAEQLCTRIYKLRKSPPALIGLSVVAERKYHDNIQAEKYLLEALSMFKYDTVVIQEIIRFYQETNQPEKASQYWRLYKLRIHQL